MKLWNEDPNIDPEFVPIKKRRKTEKRIVKLKQWHFQVQRFQFKVNPFPILILSFRPYHSHCRIYLLFLTQHAYLPQLSTPFPSDIFLSGFGGATLESDFQLEI